MPEVEKENLEEDEDRDIQWFFKSSLKTIFGGGAVIFLLIGMFNPSEIIQWLLVIFMLAFCIMMVLDRE